MTARRCALRTRGATAFPARDMAPLHSAKRAGRHAAEETAQREAKRETAQREAKRGRRQKHARKPARATKGVRDRHAWSHLHTPPSTGVAGAENSQVDPGQSNLIARSAPATRSLRPPPLAALRPLWCAHEAHPATPLSADATRGSHRGRRARAPFCACALILSQTARRPIPACTLPQTARKADPPHTQSYIVDGAL